MAELLTVDEALVRVLERARPLAAETVPLVHAAARVLAADARAAVDLPPFPSSAMDGFAVRADDTPGSLPVEVRIAAGRPAPRPLAPGEAMGIATGGVVPDGADAVVPIEQAEDLGDRVTIAAHADPGANVRAAGGDIEAGGVVLGAGTVLGAAQVAALAAAGVAEVVCARRPRVTVLATGTELRPPGAELGPGEIYESNGIMLELALSSAGAVVERQSPVEDDLDAHREALERALESDVVVSSGGVSVGPHDLVRGVARELGVEEVFWGVAMRPGKPLSFAVRDATLVFGLPGNPVSSLVGALLFVRPALYALQGAADPRPAFRTGLLAAGATRNAHRDDFVRARSELRDGDVLLRPVVGQESHMIVRAASADALVHVPRGDGVLEPGARVRYLPLV
ncbi:MAG TPA: gephyrin-like molybdotransferase Glp [Gaiella sp.]|jgi:molybdopterin molybdotransferase